MPVNVIAFGSSPRRHEPQQDAEFLRAIAWRKSANTKLADPAKAGDVAEFCRALRRLAGGRRAEWSRQTSRKKAGLPLLLQPLWSQRAWDDPTTAEILCNLLNDLQSRLMKRGQKPTASRAALNRVAASLTSAPPDASPWALVVWLTILAEAAELLDDPTLISVWRRSLLEVIPQITEDKRRTSAEHPDFADDRQLLVAGELPWLAGLAFADIKGAGKARRKGRSLIRQQLEAMTDSDGSPHARTLERLPLSLAVFVRASSQGSAFGEQLLDAASAKRFQQLVSRAAAMAHPDGRLALSNGASFGTGSLLRTASTLSGLTPQKPSYRRIQDVSAHLLQAGEGKGKRQPATRLPKVKRRRARKTEEAPSTQSDWAELACLRNNWSTGGDSCVVAYNGVFPRLSVTAFERPLIDGDWHLSVERNGTPIELTADWSCVCWFSDDDADYVELQQDSPGGIRVSRQILLSRTDHWLYLADNANLIDNESAGGTTLQMTARLPLAENVDDQDSRWTREIVLKTKKLRARAYPLRLAQERVEKTDGSLTVANGAMVLAQSSIGCGLQMPLVFDWSPDRRNREAQWQQLTIAEDGKRLPASIACGQRLRIGRHQWLFYRSHQPGETGRSVLGHHTPHESVIADFTSSGEVEPIVIVEA